MLEDGIVKQGSHNIEQGVGVRGDEWREERVRVLPTSSHPAPSLMRRRPRAASRARGGDGRIRAWRGSSAPALYSALDPIESFDERARVSPCWERVDAEARKLDPHVHQVIVSLAGEYSRILVASSDGHTSPATCARW